jgi:hypothetical protein
VVLDQLAKIATYLIIGHAWRDTLSTMQTTGDLEHRLLVDHRALVQAWHIWDPAGAY